LLRTNLKFKRNKEFKQQHYEFHELDSETTEKGRYYTTPDGQRLPSVTTVLGRKLDKSGLIEWQNAIGKDEAQKVLTQAGNRGTAVHLIAEKYLLNQDFYPPKTMPVNMATFKGIQKELDMHVNTIHAIEAPLYSLKLNTAGRTDCVATWDDIPSIIDFKTSRKIKKEEYIEGYFIQATTYSIMFEELTKLHIPQFVIIIAVDGEDKPQVFKKQTVNYYNRVYDIFCS